MVNVTIPHLKHFFQASPHPQALSGGVLDLKDVGMSPVQGGWGALSSSRLLYRCILEQNANKRANFPLIDGDQGKRAACPWLQPFLYLGQALDKLEEITHEPEHQAPYVHDAAVQRFEFCIELFWEIFRHIGKANGKEPLSQTDVVRMAYSLNLIDNMSIWRGMVRKRNQTSHSYTPTLTKEFYDYIPFYYGVMRKTYETLKNRLGF